MIVLPRIWTRRRLWDGVGRVIVRLPASILLAIVLLYRYCLSPLLPASCRFQPSCSRYAVECLRSFGLVSGGRLMVRRLLRCHPWGGCGYDPVPPSPSVLKSRKYG